MAAPDDRLLSTEEVAERLQVDEQTVRRWIKSGKLEAFKPGREWRIHPAALETLLETYSSPKARRSSLKAPDTQDGEERRNAGTAWQTEYEKRLDEMLDRWEDQLEQRVEALATGEIEAFFLWLEEIERYGRPQVSGIVAAHTVTAAHELEAVARMSPLWQAWGDLWRSIEEAKRRHGVSLSPEDERRFQEAKERSLAVR